MFNFNRTYRLFVYTIFFLCYLLLQVYATFPSPGITYDSLNYMAAARSLVEAGALLNADGGRYYEYAPLYPVLLSVGYTHIIGWATLLNGMCVVVSIFLTLQLARSYIAHAIIWRLFGLSLVFGTPLLLIGSFVWTEAVFLLLLTGQFRLLLAYDRNKKRNYFLALVVAGFLLCMQRNAGIFFVAFFSVLLFFFENKDLKIGILYFLLSASGFFIWQLYAYSASGSTFNIMTRSFFSYFISNGLVHLHLLIGWGLPRQLPLGWAISLLMLGGLGVLFYYFRSRLNQDCQLLIVLGSIMILGYLIFLSSLWGHVPPSDAERFLSVVYPIGMLCIFTFIDAIYDDINEQKQMWVAILISIWLIYPVARSIKNARLWHEQHRLYHEKSTPFRTCLKTTKQLNLTYSNILSNSQTKYCYSLNYLPDSI